MGLNGVSGLATSLAALTAIWSSWAMAALTATWSSWASARREFGWFKSLFACECIADNPDSPPGLIIGLPVAVCVRALQARSVAGMAWRMFEGLLSAPSLPCSPTRYAYYQPVSPSKSINKKKCSAVVSLNAGYRLNVVSPSKLHLLICSGCLCKPLFLIVPYCAENQPPFIIPFLSVPPPPPNAPALCAYVPAPQRSLYNQHLVSRRVYIVGKKTNRLG